MRIYQQSSHSPHKPNKALKIIELIDKKKRIAKRFGKTEQKAFAGIA